MRSTGDNEMVFEVQYHPEVQDSDPKTCFRPTPKQGTLDTRTLRTERGGAGKGLSTPLFFHDNAFGGGRGLFRLVSRLRSLYLIHFIGVLASLARLFLQNPTWKENGAVNVPTVSHGNPKKKTIFALGWTEYMKYSASWCIKQFYCEVDDIFLRQTPHRLSAESALNSYLVPGTSIFFRRYRAGRMPRHSQSQQQNIRISSSSGLTASNSQKHLWNRDWVPKAAIYSDSGILHSCVNRHAWGNLVDFLSRTFKAASLARTPLQTPGTDTPPLDCQLANIYRLQHGVPMSHTSASGGAVSNQLVRATIRQTAGNLSTAGTVNDAQTRNYRYLNELHSSTHFHCRRTRESFHRYGCINR